MAPIQSGTALTISNTNADNLFGISEDRAQVSGICSNSELVTVGPVESKLNQYFNKTCFAKPSVIGDDGLEPISVTVQWGL